MDGSEQGALSPWLAEHWTDVRCFVRFPPQLGGGASAADFEHFPLRSIGQAALPTRRAEKNSLASRLAAVACANAPE